jgi:tetratricopeptide (TPR) repeat protein
VQQGVRGQVQTPRDERAAARVRAIEALEGRFLAHAGIAPDTARGLIAWVLFDEAKSHYGGNLRTVRGFARRELQDAVEARARERKVEPPADTRSLNAIVGRLGDAFAAFMATGPRLPLIATATGPTSVARRDALRRAFFHIAFTDDAPTVPSRPPRRVPAPPAVLVGRDRERSALRALLADRPPIVVVHGIPGIGRTALALTVVHELLDDGTFENAVSYTFVGAPPSVPEVLAAVIGARPEGPATEAALHARYLALVAAPTIVLLDDVPDGWPIEQLRPPVQSILLLTAQHAIRLPDAGNLALGPLAEGDAVSVLMALDGRCQLANPEYQGQWLRWTLLGRRGSRPHPTAASELAELCGYVPGELRAAATALRELPPDMDVRVFLGWHRDSLAGGREVGSSATPARTKAYATPYARLPEEERRVFLALSAFGGTFSLEDARVVADDPEGAALVRLTRAGFVTYDVAAARYVVPMPLRLFGRRWLASDRECARVLARFAAHVTEVGMRQAERGELALSRVPADVLSTFVAAQRAAEEIADASLVARFGELAACANPPADIAEPWLDAGAVAARAQGDPAQVLRIAVARVGQYRNFALERALAAAEEALAAVPVAACEGAELLGERRVAVAQMALRAARALGRARTVLALATEVLSTNGFANAADHHTFPVLVAEAHADLGQIDDALKWARYAVREARDFPHPIYRANALNVQGAVLLAAGKRADAKRAFDAALALYPEAFDAEGGAYRAPRVTVSGQPNLDLALRDAYADQAKLHPALVAYALRTGFVEDAGEAARRCAVVAEGIVAVREFMPAFYVAFGTVLLALARRTHDHAHAAHAFYWLTCAIGLFTPRGMDDLLRSDGVDIRTLPFESMEADASAALITALTSTLFAYLQDLRAVGNAYYHRGEALLLLDDPHAAADDFEAAHDLLSTIESPLLPHIVERVRVLRRVRR